VTEDGSRVDPDSRARTHLANERTFLAWFRTGLTLIALGVAAAQFLTLTTSTGVRLVPLFSTLVIGLGVVLVAVGVWRYHGGRTRIDEERFHPAHLSVVVTSAAALVTGLLALMLVWLLPHG
jgi:putative membrane protein